MKICRKCGKCTNESTDFVCKYCEGPLKTIKSNPFSERRYGRIHLPLAGLEVNYEEILKLLADMFVTRCEFVYGPNVFSITGVHPAFDKIQEGALPIDYTLTYDTDTYVFGFGKVVKGGMKL